MNIQRGDREIVCKSRATAIAVTDPAVSRAGPQSECPPALLNDAFGQAGERAAKEVAARSRKVTVIQSAFTPSCASLLR